MTRANHALQRAAPLWLLHTPPLGNLPRATAINTPRAIWARPLQ
jgi:hypothetical protein